MLCMYVCNVYVSIWHNQSPGLYAITHYLQADDFAAGYMQGALNFPLGDAGGTIVGPEDGNFAIWVRLYMESAVKCSV